MFCGVCETRCEDPSIQFCAQCAKLMCTECTNHHQHVFGQGHDGHEVKDMNSVFRYFEELQKNSNRESEYGDVICELCNDDSCRDCVERLKQRRRETKAKKFTPQIQQALGGCKRMLVSKENVLSKLLNDLRQQESDLQQEMQRTDERIHQATNEIIFRVATALRKREAQIKKDVKTPYFDRLQRCKGISENGSALLRVVQQALGVVEEHYASEKIPSNRKIFSHLGILNKLDVSFLKGKNLKHGKLQPSEFSKPSDKDISIVCEELLKTQTCDPACLRNRPDYLRNAFHIGDADDEMSFGETDEDFGEFHVIGKQVNRIPKSYWSPIAKKKHIHVASPGGRTARDETQTQKNVPGETLHGKDISKFIGNSTGETLMEFSNSSSLSERTQRTDSSVTNASSSGSSHKSQRIGALKSLNQTRLRKNRQQQQQQQLQQDSNSVRSNSHSEIYRSVQPPKPLPRDGAEELRSRSTGNLMNNDHSPSTKKPTNPERKVRNAAKHPNSHGRSSPTKFANPSEAKQTGIPYPSAPPYQEPTTDQHTSSRDPKEDLNRPPTVKWQHNGNLPSFVYFSDVHQEYGGSTGSRRLSYVPRALLEDFDDGGSGKKSFPIPRPRRRDADVVRTTNEMLRSPMLKSTPL